MSKKSYELDMCNGPIVSNLLAFALPLMASQVLQLLFNTADTIVVGRFAGDNALAAVGSSGPLITMLTTLFTGLSIGANVLVSRYHAKQEKDKVETIVHTAMTLALICGLFLTVFGIIFAPQLLRWMNSPEDVIGLATVYLRYYFIGTTAMMLYNFGSAIFRSVGDTKRPLYFLTISGIVNVVLNLLFVIVLHMSVVGVALATIISQLLSCGMLLSCMLKEEGTIHLNLKKLGIDGGCCMEIIQIGVPAGIQAVIFTGSNVVIQSAVNSFGSTIVAGNAAGSSLEGFIWMGMNAFQQTAVSFIAQNHGARQYDRIKAIIVRLEFIVFAFGLVFGNLLYIFHNFFLGLYSTSPEVIAVGALRLSIICVLYFFSGMMDVMGGVLRGLGYSLMPTITALVGVIGIRIMWILTFFRLEQFHTIRSLYLTYPVSWITTLILHLICLKVIWKKVQMQK